MSRAGEYCMYVSGINKRDLSDACDLNPFSKDLINKILSTEKLGKIDAKESDLELYKYPVHRVNGYGFLQRNTESKKVRRGMIFKKEQDKTYIKNAIKNDNKNHKGKLEELGATDYDQLLNAIDDKITQLHILKDQIFNFDLPFEDYARAFKTVCSM